MMTSLPTILHAIGNTPLVALRNLSKDLPHQVLAKCEHLNPGGSIKDRIAHAIIQDAEASGALRPGGTVIEATAGNTGIGLAIVAAIKGYTLVCVMPQKMSVDKRRALRALGARVIVTPNCPPSDPQNFQHVAASMAKEHGWFLADQFANPANLRAHIQGTAQEILEQTGGRIGAFVAGAGTGGTISGVGKRLKEEIPGLQVILADPVGSGLADWVAHHRMGEDGAYEVEGIGSSKVPVNFHRDLVDRAISISDAESFETTRRLIREEGLLVGGSAGTNVAAALRVAAEATLPGPVVTVLQDSWDRYWAKPWMHPWMEDPDQDD